MSVRARESRTGTTVVNGAELYHEIRGGGPSVLLIVGATGDYEWYGRAADLLADEFTVVTYDRRGNSRSPRPAGWKATSMDEQADDAAGLIEFLGLAPAAVFGSSGGGVITLDLAARRPGVLRGAIVHEPPVVAVLPDGEAVMAQFQAMGDEAMAKGGPRLAMEMFVRVAAGDRSFEAMDPIFRERALGNAELFFGLELQPFATFVPDHEAIKRAQVPVVVSAGEDHRDPDTFNHYLYRTSQRVAESLGTELIEFPGAHVPYYDRPKEFVDVVKPCLRKMG
jgi:pimeloyl-ACP methyl ester carboxylesterase